MKSKEWRDRIVLLEDCKEDERDKGGIGREVQQKLIILTVSYSFAHKALKAMPTKDLHQFTSGDVFCLCAWQSQAKEDEKIADEEH